MVYRKKRNYCYHVYVLILAGKILLFRLFVKIGIKPADGSLHVHLCETNFSRKNNTASRLEATVHALMNITKLTPFCLGGIIRNAMQNTLYNNNKISPDY
jgi:hypothetical protein